MTHVAESRPSAGRPDLRARAATAGARALTDAELLSMLLARSAPRADAGSAARALLDRLGCLAAVAAAPPRELEAVAGLAPGVALDLGLMREFAERLARDRVVGRSVISSWTALLAYVRVALAEQPREQLRVLFLDKRNQLLRDEMAAEGTVDHAPVYPREIMRRALELSASAVILVHNHPSGDPTPSPADIEMTRQVIEAGRALKIAVHDHLVVGASGVASFKSLGLI
jgi:DNA repair protein RadC